MKTTYILFISIMVCWSVSTEKNPSLLLSWGNDGQTNISDTQIYNTFARVFGAPRVFSKSDKSQSANNLFTPPPGNLFFIVEGASTDRKSLISGSVIEISPSVLPYSAFNTISCALTGITQDFLSVGYESVGNIFDALLQLHKKEFTVITASSSLDALQLVSPHQESSTSGTESLFWNTKTGKYSTAFSKTSSFAITREDFPLLLSKLSSLLKSNSLNVEVK